MPLHLEADIALLRGKFTGTCRREVPRQRFEAGTIGFLTAENGSRKEVWLVDLSEKGISFYLARELDPGTPLVLQFSGPAQDLLTITAKVAHATLRNNGDWLIGCEFENRLDSKVLEDLQ